MLKGVLAASLGLLTLFLFVCTLSAQSVATVVRDANLRAGPGTKYAIVGSAKAGESVAISGTNAAGDWYQLDTGKWIAAFLLKTGESFTPAATIIGTIVPTKVAPTVTPTTTPLPTHARTPTPTPTPDPNLAQGVGDSVLTLNKTEGAMMLHIIGNLESRYFSVENYGAYGQIGLLVNTTEPYDGIVPLDFRQNELTTRLSIKAPGAWAVQVLPLSKARVLRPPSSINGTGDEVIQLFEPPDTLSIVGNLDGRYFAVTSYGSRADLLVNTVDPYQGTVLIRDPKAVILVIQSTGPWTIESTRR